MDSTIFKNDEAYYFNEFYKVLELFIFSCEKMILKENFNLTEWENFLRSILVKKYLRKYKSNFQIDHLNFYSEVEEISANHGTLGFIDIHISNPMKIIGKEDLFYAFECKRLDGGLTKNKEYINNGLSRFIDGKYSKKMSLAGMIGFVQGFKKSGNVNSLVVDIKDVLNKHKIIKTTKNLTKYTIDKKFKYSYFSQHKRKKPLSKIDLYHLFFDFTCKKYK